MLRIPDDSISMQSFGLRDYEAGIQKAGLRLLTFPIIEMAAPVCINATHTIIKQTTELVAQGHHVAVHCRSVSMYISLCTSLPSKLAGLVCIICHATTARASFTMHEGMPCKMKLSRMTCTVTLSVCCHTFNSNRTEVQHCTTLALRALSLCLCLSLQILPDAKT